MCGISAFVSKAGLSGSVLGAFTDVVKHRGPDDEGYLLVDAVGEFVVAGGQDTPISVWQTDTPYKPFKHISECNGVYRFGLGHRRLSILDLSPKGHFPMCEQSQRYWITYNGEIYNYLELKEELQLKGRSFTSDSDTEVILQAYMEWGHRCLGKLNGMFAFVIFDLVEKKFFLARDRFGIKPLYYWRDQNQSVFFASEIKQFTACPGWVAKLNKPRAYDYLFYSISDHTDETMFRGVFQFRPGHMYEGRIDDIFAEQGQLATNSWYKLPKTKFTNGFEMAKEIFLKRFKESVNLHLRSDVPVGSALSGGLDSSAIVCEVASLLAQEGKQGLQKTYSSVSTDSRYSEKKWMDIIIEKTKVQPHFVYPTAQSMFSQTLQILWHQDEPYQSQSVFLGYCVFEEAKKSGVKVLLNGQGADEYLSGYSEFRLARLRKLLFKFRWIQLNRELRQSGITRFQNIMAFFLKSIAWLLPVKVAAFFSRRQSAYKVLKDVFDESKLTTKKSHPLQFMPKAFGTPFSISRQQLFYSPLPKYLHWEDRNSMAHSIEARVPFLDHRLVEFCNALPLEFLDGPGQTKKILRHSLTGILPDQVRQRSDKMGFTTPEERWVKEDFTVLFREKIQESILVSNGVIKHGALRYFDKVVAGELPFDFTYWRIILFGEWMKLFNVIVEKENED